MSNPSFPTLLKIGKSKKDPTTDRVNELNQTGVPEPFKVDYYAFVEDEDYLERVVHQKFASQRPNKNREFFRVDCAEAIEAIRQLATEHSALKYEQLDTDVLPQKILKIPEIKRLLSNYLQHSQSKYLELENRFLNQALKVLIPCLLLIIFLGILFG